MKILIIGDPHFKINNLPDMKKMTDEILQVIDRTTPDLCVYLGDTLDTQRIKPHCHTVSFFKDIAIKCRLVIMIEKIIVFI